MKLKRKPSWMSLEDWAIEQASDEDESIEFRSDEEFLVNGEVPIFVEDCAHSDMEPVPRGAACISACKHCGQLMVPTIPSVDKPDAPRVWEVARGRVTLPVTIQKIVDQTVLNAMTFNPKKTK